MSNKEMTLELGQMLFGNSTGQYGADAFVAALIAGLLDAIDTVYWNIYQRHWDKHSNPGLPGVVFNAYCWDDADEEACSKPNLVFAFSRQEIRWYKHSGRSQSFTEDFSAEEWHLWYNAAHALIWSAMQFKEELRNNKNTDAL